MAKQKQAAGSLEYFFHQNRGCPVAVVSFALLQLTPRFYNIRGVNPSETAPFRKKLSKTMEDDSRGDSIRAIPTKPNLDNIIRAITMARPAQIHRSPAASRRNLS